MVQHSRRCFGGVRWLYVAVQQIYRIKESARPVESIKMALEARKARYLGSGKLMPWHVWFPEVVSGSEISGRFRDSEAVQKNTVILMDCRVVIGGGVTADSSPYVRLCGTPQQPMTRGFGRLRAMIGQL